MWAFKVIETCESLYMEVRGFLVEWCKPMHQKYIDVFSFFSLLNLVYKFGLSS
jgi:hypothetical protein